MGFIIKKIKSICSQDARIEIRINDDKLSQTFESWNEQFEDKRDLKEYIPEYGMTLGQYRKKIFDSEFSGDDMTLEEFFNSLDAWKKTALQK